MIIVLNIELLFLTLQAIVHQGDIVECAAIPLKDKLKGHVPVGLCVLKPSKLKALTPITYQPHPSVTYLCLPLERK